MFCRTKKRRPAADSIMSTNSFTILLVEDNAEQRLLFGNALYEIDAYFKTILATGGRAALSYLAACNGSFPEAVFISTEITDINCFGLLRKLDDRDYLKDILIIL